MGVSAASNLRPGALSLLEIVGQSLAAVSPTLTPALNISVVASLAGTGCWMSYLIGMLGVIIVAGNVGVLASRHPEAGSFFVYIGRNVGPLAGALTGWGMISAYLFTAVATTLSFAIFLQNAFAVAGVHLHTPVMTASMLGFVALMTYSAYHDVRLSSRAGLVLELLSILIILVITAIVVFIHGTVIDPAQLQLSALGYRGIFSALPFVVFSFVGFESAATFAKETSNPRRNIPRAVIGCAALSGVLFTLMAYFMVLCMGGDTAALGSSSAPFRDVAQKAGLNWAPGIVYFAAMISVFACSLASINAAARLMYSMGKYRFLHASMGHVHARHRTPNKAILLCGFALAIICPCMMPLGPMDAFGYAGTFASFGFVVAYLGVCVVTPIDLKRSRQLRSRHVWVAGVGGALMLFVLVGSVYPAPVYPYSMLPYLFLLWMLAGFIWFARLRITSPPLLAAIEHDMEG
jgi:amino acid transporter